jgi:hypothetical protein
MQLPLALVVALLLASGLLLSRIRFCMVAAVAEAVKGDWGACRCIATIALAISAVLLLLGVADGHAPMQLNPNWRVPLGGLLFGIAAAWNRGCFIGTTIQLSGGNLNALLPITGWVVGFRLLQPPRLMPLPDASPWRTGIALVALVALMLWLIQRQRTNQGDKVDWHASFACGLMLGLLDNDRWGWSPSTLASSVAHIGAVGSSWLGLVMLLGMAVESALQGRFHWRLPDWRQWGRLPMGIAMAIGASLAMGGNDSQILRYLPGGSPHGWLAVPTMAIGVLLGQALAKAVQLRTWRHHSQ